MKLFNRIKYNNKNYIYAGFGEITKKKYLIKNNNKGEYIIFNNKRTYLKEGLK